MAKDNENIMGHTKDYATVLINSKELIDFDENGKEINVTNDYCGLSKEEFEEFIVGACCLVKVTKSGKFFLMGQIVRTDAWKKAMKQLVQNKEIKAEKTKEKVFKNLFSS